MDKDTSSYIALGAIVCVALVAIVSIVSLNGSQGTGENVAGAPTFRNQFTGPVQGTGEETGEPYTPCEEGTFKCEDYIRPCDLGDMATGLCEPCTVSPCGASAQQINEGPRQVMQCIENERKHTSLVARLFARLGFSGTPPEITTLWRIKGICPEETTCTENPPECHDEAGNVYAVTYDWLPDEDSEESGTQTANAPNTAEDDLTTSPRETNTGFPRPPTKGGTPTNPNSGGSFGCDWENDLDLSRCSGPEQDNQLEVYDNTDSCVQQGNEVVYTIHLRGLAHPGQRAFVDEHFSRKSGEIVTVYNYHRSCTSGGQVQNQHADLIYQCAVYGSCTCSPQAGIQCDEQEDPVVYAPPVEDTPYILQES